MQHEIVKKLLLSIISFLTIVLLFGKVYFVRKPKEIRITNQENALISPAEGKILRIEKINIQNPNDLKSKAYKKGMGRYVLNLTTLKPGNYTIIHIFMSIFDNHNQIIPIDGEIIDYVHKKGKHWHAGKKHFYENEKAELTLKTKFGNIKIIQIAGLIARRIQNFITHGKVKQGLIYGRILFGSRVIIIVPNFHTDLKEGDKVKVGQILGNIKN